jgi:hypothetical protein
VGIQFGRKDYGARQPMPRNGNDDRTCVQHGECRPKHVSGKSTRHWCKGKVGVEHDWQWVNPSSLPNRFHVQRRPMTAEDKAKHEAKHGLGYLSEVQVCARCSKQQVYGYGRKRCHCGALMEPRPTPRRRWVSEWRCPSCAYVVGGVIETGHWQWVDASRTKKVWVDTTPPRALCECEKLAARLHRSRARKGA